MHSLRCRHDCAGLVLVRVEGIEIEIVAGVVVIGVVVVGGGGGGGETKEVVTGVVVGEDVLGGVV